MHSPLLLKVILATSMTIASLSTARATPASTSFADFDARAKAGEPLSVAFLGGSLTFGANSSDPLTTSYRGLMAEYLRQKYPKSSFTFHDAAIGGTGSTLGMFRLERDVLAHKPDLVFLDFTINDNIYESSPKRLASYEILLREMIGRGIPVEVITMGDKKTAAPDFDVKTLGTYQEHLKLIEAYGTAHGDTLPRLKAVAAQGKEALDVLYPFDGIHPDDPGYHLFFEAARDGFEKGVKDKASPHVPATPVFSDEYATRERIRLIDLPLPAGWKRSKTYRTSLWFDGLSSRWMGDVILCDIKNKADVQPLRVEFEGTFVALFGEANQDGLGFHVLIDGQPLLYTSDKKDVPPSELWPFDTSRFGVGNLFKFQVLTDNLKPGRHTLEIRPEFPADAKKGQLRIESICVAGPKK